ncbi:NADP-dependent oxidoreductase [Caulobacter flavus]|jgi:NADPH-dependent curcumin reductase CurA|uniref:NADP-dependent oxidoreductase n=1 Tax=Caulobacter flavus TaxID=1679497 RepID=A0A2N5CSD3_9CAUL|nr:NADP-dependent oxidoreductase [Caulobacter flavus]AYV49034.1 NADP-dependent oxidoreductase [Caulobacter flavus]PLR13378.1 NADP-dependent oxidoreductase [Caulobacter flavus]
MTTSREIRLKSRPVGVPTTENFELASVELPPPGDGEIQVKNLWMSVDPYMRGRMTDRKSYVPPFELGKALQGGAVGEVTASNDPDFKVGDIVSSMFGWREAYNANPKALAAAGPMGGIMKLSTHGMPPQAFLGVAGMPGMTAYAGLLRVAALKEGDIVFVSAAAGAVGSVVCQIAKIKGHTVIGSAGGPEKVAFLKEIGVDHVIDYKATPDVVAELAKVAPKGIDVYFENVGGAHLEAALNSARPFGRFALCGMISQYNETGRPTGPANIIQAVGKSLRLEGFIVSNHYDLFPAFVRDMADWINSGKLTWKETVEEGVERAPEAFIKLFSGENLGKMLVKL